MSHYCYIHVEKTSPNFAFNDLEALNEALSQSAIGELLDGYEENRFVIEQNQKIHFWDRESECHRHMANVYSCVAENELSLLSHHIAQGKLLICTHYEGSTPKYWLLSPGQAAQYSFPLC